jgi:hypothetical protein
LLQLNQHNLNQLVPLIKGFQEEEAQLTGAAYTVGEAEAAQVLLGVMETAVLMARVVLGFNTLNLSGH